MQNALGEIAAKRMRGEEMCGTEETRRRYEYLTYSAGFLMLLSLGSCNKILLLTLDNGKEVIARLPFPMAGPPHLLTASEAATMEFLRTVLSVPVPQVLSWSSRADSTPVGAEFIIMEKLPASSWNVS